MVYFVLLVLQPVEANTEQKEQHHKILMELLVF